MCGPLPLARGPFAFTRTRVDLFWSLALRRAWTIIRERIFFYCLRRTRGQYYIKRSDLCPPRWTFLDRADLLSVMGGCLSLAHFHLLGPQVDFSVHSRFACGSFSPRADLFLLLARITHGQYPIKRTDLCQPRADLSYVMGGPLSFARGPFSFIRTPSGLLWSLLLRTRTILSSIGPFTP